MTLKIPNREVVVGDRLLLSDGYTTAEVLEWREAFGVAFSATLLFPDGGKANYSYALDGAVTMMEWFDDDGGPVCEGCGGTWRKAEYFVIRAYADGLLLCDDCANDWPEGK